MGVIIGAGTTVGGVFANTCVVSVSWGYNPNVQRLYCIGSWTAYKQFERPTQSLNITIYATGAGSGSAGTVLYSTVAATSCTTANTIDASVNPAECVAVAGAVSGQWFVSGYSYSKDDALMPGQESWSMTRWLAPNQPTHILRGIAEGTGSIPGTHEADPGILFSGALSESTTGSVSAGAIGRSDRIRAGVVARVGGGSSEAGKTGKGDASIPYTPLWI